MIPNRVITSFLSHDLQGRKRGRRGREEER